MYISAIFTTALIVLVGCALQFLVQTIDWYPQHL
jgi:hypothetical protein